MRTKSLETQFRKTRILILVSITMIYAVCFVAIKAGLPFAPPLQFAGWRAFIAGLSLLAVTVLLRQPLLPNSHQWCHLFMLGLTATTITYAGMFLSPGRVGAGVASVLGNVQPLITIILAGIFLGERLTQGKVTALLLGLIGVTLIVSPSLNTTDNGSVLGLVLALTASVGSACGSVLFKTMNSQHQLLTITAWQLIVGSVPLFAGSFAIEHDMRIIWNGEFLGLLFFLALIGTALTSVVWYWLVQREDVGRLSISLFFVPVLGLAIGVVVLGEEVSLLKAIGVAIVLVGVTVAIIESSRISLTQAPMNERQEHH